MTLQSKLPNHYAFQSYTVYMVIKLSVTLNLSALQNHTNKNI